MARPQQRQRGGGGGGFTVCPIDGQRYLASLGACPIANTHGANPVPKYRECMQCHGAAPIEGECSNCAQRGRGAQAPKCPNCKNNLPKPAAGQVVTCTICSWNSREWWLCDVCGSWYRPTDQARLREADATLPVHEHICPRCSHKEWRDDSLASHKEDREDTQSTHREDRDDAKRTHEERREDMTRRTKEVREDAKAADALRRDELKRIHAERREEAKQVHTEERTDAERDHRERRETNLRKHSETREDEKRQHAETREDANRTHQETRADAERAHKETREDTVESRRQACEDAKAQAEQDRRVQFAHCKDCNRDYPVADGVCKVCHTQCGRCGDWYLKKDPACPRCRGVSYRLVVQVVEAGDHYEVKKDIYRVRDGVDEEGVAGEVETLDGGVKKLTAVDPLHLRPGEVPPRGATFHLPFQRKGRVVRFSVLSVTDGGRTFNPNVHTDPLTLAGQPASKLKKKLTFDPALGPHQSFWRALRDG